MALTRNFVGDNAVFLGDDTELEFTIYTSSAETTILDVTGAEIAFAIRKSDKSDTAEIEKTTEGSPSPTGVSISGVFNADPAINDQTVTVTLADTDTYDPTVSPAIEIRAGRYRYSLKRMDAGSETTLYVGDFEFVQGAVR